MSAKDYRIVVEGDDSTNYSAYSPDVPGVVATGATRQECERELLGAIEFHLEGVADDASSLAQGDSSALLEFVDVSVRHADGSNRFTVLDRVSFAIQAGQHVGVYGQRRSGKSTLLRVAAGVEAPSSGAVRFERRDIASISSRQRARLLRDRIALVSPSDWSPRAGETVVDYVALAISSGGDTLRGARRRALLALELMDVQDRADHLAVSLGGADRVRVMLARGLVRKPSLLLVDEPASIPSLADRDSLYTSLGALMHHPGPTLVVASEDVTALRGMTEVHSIADGELVRVQGPRRGQGQVVEFPRRSRYGR